MRIRKHVWEEQKSEEGQCRNCPGCEQNHPFVGAGPRNAKVMVLSMYPPEWWDPVYLDPNAHVQGFMDGELEGVGALVMQIEVAAGIPHGGVYYTPIIKCRPGDEDTRREHCQPYAIQELGMVQPDLLVCYGEVGSEWIQERIDTAYEEGVEVSSDSPIEKRTVIHCDRVEEADDRSAYFEQISQAVKKADI